MIRSSVAVLLVLHCTAQSSMLPAQPDWLRIANASSTFPATFAYDGATLTLSNGIVTRIFTLLLNDTGAFGTTEYATGADATSFLRGVGPEARVTVNAAGAEVTFDVGGFLGQTQYLTYYAEDVQLQSNPLAMSMVNFSTSRILPQYNYLPRWGVSNASWPPAGVHLAVDFGPPAGGPPGTFAQLNGTGIGCAAPLTCLTGWYACDNSSVPNQCSFPRATAASLCAQWPLCVAVTCNNARDDCQARSSLAQSYAADFTSFVDSIWFPAPDLRVTLHYELYDGVPLLAKWMTLSSTGADVVVPSVATEVLHVPWELRTRVHAETAYMPSIGERNSMEAAGWDAGDMGFTG